MNMISIVISTGKIVKTFNLWREVQVNKMIDNNFVPETLEWCETHYIPPIKDYINCKDFGNSGGMNGGCWQCMELTPYQFEMCADETWLRGLLSSTARKQCKSREEASEFIEEHKQRYPRKNVIEYLYELRKRRKDEEAMFE